MSNAYDMARKQKVEATKKEMNGTKDRQRERESKVEVKRKSKDKKRARWKICERQFLLKRNVFFGIICV